MYLTSDLIDRFAAEVASLRSQGNGPRGTSTFWLALEDAIEQLKAAVGDYDRANQLFSGRMRMMIDEWPNTPRPPLQLIGLAMNLWRLDRNRTAKKRRLD